MKYRTSGIMRWMPPIAVGGIALLSALGGCSDASSREATRRDSAGIAIVSLSIDTAGVHRYSLRRVASVGVREDDFLDGVTSATTSGELLAVGNAGGHEIRIYDRRGELVQSVGKEGSGPCEFRNPYVSKITRGDSILAYDVYLARIYVMDPVSGDCRELPLMPPTGGLMPLTRIRGVFPDGRFLVSAQISTASMGSYEEEEGSTPVPQLAAVLDADSGRLTVDYGTLGVDDLYLVPMSPGGTALGLAGGTPFGADVSIRLLDSLAYLFDNRRYQVAVLREDGDTATLFRGADWRPRKIDTNLRDLHLEQWIFADRVDSESAGRRRLIWGQVRYPGEATAYGGRFVDGAGRIWLEPYDLWDGISEHWLVYSAEGARLGQVSLPYHAYVFDATRTDLIVREYGPNLEEHVVWYRHSLPESRKTD